LSPIKCLSCVVQIDVYVFCHAFIFPVN
jgi:hypothetical protein